MNSQLAQTLEAFTTMIAFALVVGGILFFFCLGCKRLGLMRVIDVLTIFAWLIVCLINSEKLNYFFELLVAASFCALFKVPVLPNWGSRLRFLLTSGSASLILGSMVFGVIITQFPLKATSPITREYVFTSLVISPCAILVMHSIVATMQLRPGIDRHLNDGDEPM